MKSTGYIIVQGTNTVTVNAKIGLVLGYKLLYSALVRSETHVKRYETEVTFLDLSMPYFRSVLVVTTSLLLHHYGTMNLLVISFKQRDFDKVKFVDMSDRFSVCVLPAITRHETLCFEDFNLQMSKKICSVHT